MADEDNHDRLPQAFEQLLGLPLGTLVLTQDRSNRSLTFAEAELVRSVNGLFKQEGWTDEAYHRLIQGGLVMHLRNSAPAAEDSPLPALPEWASRRVAELNAGRVEGVRQSGVRVLGHLEQLLTTERTQGPIQQPTMLSLLAARTALEGTLRMAMKREKRLRERVETLRPSED